MFACSIAASAVVFSTFSGPVSNPAIEQQIVTCKIIALTIAFALVVIANDALVKDTMLAMKQFRKNNGISIFKEGVFETGRFLSFSGIILTFACLANQVLSIRVILSKCSIAGMGIGIIAYVVGVILVLYIGPSVLEEEDSV